MKLFKTTLSLLFLVVIFSFCSCNSAINVSKKVNSCKSGIYLTEFGYSYFNHKNDTCLILMSNIKDPLIDSLIRKIELTHRNFEKSYLPSYSQVYEEPWGVDYEIKVPSCLHFIPIKYFLTFTITSKEIKNKNCIYTLMTWDGSMESFWELKIEGSNLEVSYMYSKI